MSTGSAMYLYREGAGSLPLTDLFETEESLVLKMDLPGINPDDVLIKVYGDTILVEGLRQKGLEQKGAHFICMERSFESFRRMITIPVPVDTASGRASYEQGVLTVSFPKVRDRVIKIRIEK